MQNKTFMTSDGVEISGLYDPSNEEKFVILLHMMPATKESWLPFMELLSQTGYGSLAIDLRGHGKSVNHGGLDYKTFSDKQHQKSLLDVEAAFEFLKDLGVEEEDIVVMGASIGANLAIQFLQQHPHVLGAIALSAGIDYRGVVTDVPIQDLEEDQKILLLASSEDEYAFESAVELQELCHGQTTFIKEKGLGHGTDLFVNKPELMDEVIEWIENEI